MSDKLRINFVLPPSPKISGGPLAILEYANRFAERGHTVSVTTYPDTMWAGENPFPWFNFRGTVHFKRMRNSSGESSSLSMAALRLLGKQDIRGLAKAFVGSFGVQGLEKVILEFTEQTGETWPAWLLANELLTGLCTMEAMPDCDLNIASLWSTAFAVFFSRKGKPVYFMQHYEEIFYGLQTRLLLHKLGARVSYQLPLYKVANSSWLQKQIRERCGQDVPFSNNALELSDFSPRPKKSEVDGIIRVVTYAQAFDWKGFADAVAAMTLVRERYGDRVEWNVFGYRHPTLTEANLSVRYKYHPNLSFAQLAELYATSDIALCPPWYESFPLPPLEAMASGTAVVTTDLGTEDYAVHERNALVVGARNSQAMASAISRLIEDEELRARLAQEGRRTAERFTWDRAVTERESILLKIHHGDVAYDVWKTAQLGLRDGTGVEFERSPSDISLADACLFWYQGDLFLFYRGKKHHITGSDVIPHLVEADLRYVTIDDVMFARIPSGSSIYTTADIPSTINSPEICEPA